MAKSSRREAPRGVRRGGRELPPEVQDRPEQNAGYDEAVRGGSSAPPRMVDAIEDDEDTSDRIEGVEDQPVRREAFSGFERLDDAEIVEPDATGDLDDEAVRAAIRDVHREEDAVEPRSPRKDDVEGRGLKHPSTKSI